MSLMLVRLECIWSLTFSGDFLAIFLPPYPDCRGPAVVLSSFCRRVFIWNDKHNRYCSGLLIRSSLIRCGGSNPPRSATITSQKRWAKTDVLVLLPPESVQVKILHYFIIRSRCHEVDIYGIRPPRRTDYIGGFTHGKKQMVLASTLRW